MGTRNLTMVIDKDGQTKVAQYGQWDGYPSGVGVGILSMLRTKGFIETLQEKLNLVRFIDEQGRDKEFIDSYNKNAPEFTSSPDNRTPEQKEWFKNFCTRDLAEDVLANINASEKEEILLQDNSGFAADSLFCEYAYVIDLQKQTFEVYQGFNKSELPETDRFYGMKRKDDSEYYPVRLIKTFSLSELPERGQFLKEVEPEEDEEQP